MATPFNFSESTNKTGLYELFQDLTKTNSTSYTAYKYARDANNALADYFINLAIPNSGTAQADDTNQTDFPELKINLVSGQFDYPLTSDASSIANQILDIERVEMATESTANVALFTRLQPYDEMQEGINSLVAERNATAIPYRYAKRANSIFLDPTPNFSATNGLRIFYARTPSYFVGTDTTKVAGIPHAHQEYLVYRPAYLYCVTNLPQLANGYLAIVLKLEKQIASYYARRDKDTRHFISSEPINFR